MSSTLAWIVACVLSHTPATDAAPVGPVAPAELADLRPLEVRIRRLHLVRPDLLQFPIPYDTIC